jgi:hypothetical protein
MTLLFWNCLNPAYSTKNSSEKVPPADARQFRNFSRASEGSTLSICTFPDKKSAASAAEALESGSIPFVLIDSPQDVMHSSCSPIALACMVDDQEKVGSFLGEHGIQISAMHRMRPRSWVVENREKEFWEKVELINKGKK